MPKSALLLLKNCKNRPELCVGWGYVDIYCTSPSTFIPRDLGRIKIIEKHIQTITIQTNTSKSSQDTLSFAAIYVGFVFAGATHADLLKRDLSKYIKK